MKKVIILITILLSSTVFCSNLAYSNVGKTANNQEIDKHMKTLGVSDNSSKAEIKAAYRLKMKDYHPDTWMHENDKRIAANATKKAQRIQNSYKAIQEYKKNEQ